MGDDNKNDLLIIGAGLGRTGTKSLSNALTVLGYKTYHMEDKIENRNEDRDVWNRWARTEVDTADPDEKKAAIREILDLFKRAGVNATTDFPACVLYREFMEVYPNAKVILSARRSGEKWATSFDRTIGRVAPAIERAGRPWRWIPAVDRFIRDDLTFNAAFFKRVAGMEAYASGAYTAPFPLQSFTKEQMEIFAKAHDDWKAEVIRHVPTEKLLIYHPGDGYRPLCTFLGIENCPTGNPPKGWNTSQTFSKIISALEILTFFGPWLILMLYAYFTLNCCCARKRKGSQKDGGRSKND